MIKELNTVLSLLGTQEYLAGCVVVTQEKVGIIT